MKRMCREILKTGVQLRPPLWREAFPHASIIVDPTKLAQLKAEVVKCRLRDLADERSEYGLYDRQADPIRG